MWIIITTLTPGRQRFCDNNDKENWKHLLTSGKFQNTHPQMCVPHKKLISDLRKLDRTCDF